MPKKLEKSKRKKKKEERKRIRNAIFWGIVTGLSSGTPNKSNKTDLMPWEEAEINNGNYEPYNFEEENLEEDDFYFEDID